MMMENSETRFAGDQAPDIPVPALMPCDPEDAYNFERTGPGRYRLTVAVPGFERADLEVSADTGCLRICGTAPPAMTGGWMLHRGLDDALDRTFLMLRPMELAGWDVRAGLLQIGLEDGPGIPAQAARPPVLHHVEAVAMAA